MSVEVAIVVTGDPDRTTGGYLYNRRMVDGLNEAGINAAQVALVPGGRPADLLVDVASSGARLVLIDSIAIEGFSRTKVGRRFALGALVHMIPSDSARWFRRPFVLRASRRFLSGAEPVIAAGEYLASRIRAMGVPKERIFVVPPGRDGVPSGAPIARGKGVVQFLCVANWSPSKAIDLVIRAFEEGCRGLPARLDLVGDPGSSRYSRRCFRLIERFHLEDRVRVLGPQAGQELAAAYASADVFAFASTSEGYPTVCAEALNAGLPVVGFAARPTAELTGDAAVLAPPEDFAGLARAMRALTKDREERDLLTKRAAARARELPTWRESVGKFTETVSEILESAGFNR